MKRVLIIDALNMYLRAYIVDPSISTNGQPIGGLKGSLKILQKLVRDTKPDNVVICWDGPNGSMKRKIMDKNYKEGRKPIRLNRAFHNLSEDEETTNKVWQERSGSGLGRPEHGTGRTLLGCRACAAHRLHWTV